MTPSAQRFSELIDERSVPVPESGCLLWIGSANAKGYGKFSVRGVRSPVYAHRAAFELASGSGIPNKMDVCHKCDTPACVNPAHLFLGTRRENLADMIKKGRGRASTSPNSYPRGEQAARWRRSLTASAVVEIRQSALSIKALAEKYGVTVQTISRAATGKGYAHIDAPDTRPRNRPWAFKKEIDP